MLPFYKKYLFIDLNSKSYEVRDLSDDVLDSYGGGKGIGTYLLYELNPEGVDPFSEDNHLIINVGPAADQKVWGSYRFGVYTKSPLTNCYVDSTAGGKLAKPISRTGYDAIVIRGKSNAPIFLEISDKEVKFHDASDLWGKDTYYTEDELKRRVGVKGAGAIVIGPAGENLVKFALVENDYWRSIGRGGIGAVFGSKKIKGIVFHGNAKREIGFPDELEEFFKLIGEKGKNDPISLKYKEFGTAMGVSLLNEVGAFPTRYWHKGKLDGFENITIERQKEICDVVPKACPACFISCGNLTKTRPDSKYPGIILEGPEYETLYAFGGLCCIRDIEDIIYINDKCDRLGIDTITAGNIVAFAMELSAIGKIKERYEYGNVNHVIELIEKIVYGDGVGEILSHGIEYAARYFDAEDLAIHNKGLEPAGYDPRALKGTALGYAVSCRGACHLRSGFYKAELSGVIDPDVLEGKAELLVDWEDRFCIFDTFILCRFFRDTYLWDETLKLWQMLYGDNSVTKEELKQRANKIISLAKKFNIRENPDKIFSLDKLPKRLFEEPLESGKVLKEDEFNRLLQDYYALRGWDKDGVPKD
ncbi:aldehyde ferredoxin oxidoreductase family protein [Deferribacter autotrophicus]|uniref:Aldehyde ferredoxin oxidoreductase family protein n=1 Tax=Deferribacter autotrophicus TaxID=500465 RepID=A0A5A8F373_9BACT|nr:aldehyde ferredoxin oxidoreductase family protein [Deferribacter autotrophicus]KAA0256895.1 aldehyde ferredoxin oxidoreductase family protein [Deferribacter autotrophicus]